MLLPRGLRLRLRAPQERPGFVMSLGVGGGGGGVAGVRREEPGDASGLTCGDSRGRGGGGEAAGPQMMVGTLPPLLPRLLFFLDRLGVAMSTKRSSGQPYCSRTSMHSWLEACRA